MPAPLEALLSNGVLGPIKQVFKPQAGIAEPIVGVRYNQFMFGKEKYPDRADEKRRKLLIGGAAVLGLAAIEPFIKSRKIDLIPNVSRPEKGLGIFEKKEYAVEAFKGAEKFGVRLHEPYSPDFLNVGVEHVERFLEYQMTRTALGAAIAESEMVLLEYGGNYFPSIAGFAERLGKNVLSIDSSQGRLQSCVKGLASLGGATLIATAPDKEKARDGFIQTLVGMGLLEAGEVSPTAYYHVLFGDAKKYPAYDVSHMIDARTVFMVAEIHRIRSENPGKKIVVVTGDNHALGIENYLSDRGKHEWREKMYNVIYGILKQLPQVG